MKLLKRVAVGILVALLTVSLLTACNGNSGGEEQNPNTGTSDNQGTNEDKKDDAETGNASSSDKKDNADKGDSGNSDESIDKTISWQESLTSKIYPIDVRVKGGTLKFGYTANDGTIQMKFIRSTSSQQRRMMEYCEERQQGAYLWYKEFNAEKGHVWKLYTDGSYQPLQAQPNGFTITSYLANGPSSLYERKAIVGKKTYKGKTYRTEKFEAFTSGIPFECTYYFDGTELKVIEVVMQGSSTPTYLNNIMIQVSSTTMDDTNSILTEKEKTKINPDNYTLREN